DVVQARRAAGFDVDGPPGAGVLALDLDEVPAGGEREVDRAPSGGTVLAVDEDDGREAGSEVSSGGHRVAGATASRQRLHAFGGSPRRGAAAVAQSQAQDPVVRRGAGPGAERDPPFGPGRLEPGAGAERQRHRASSGLVSESGAWSSQ